MGHRSGQHILSLRALKKRRRLLYFYKSDHSPLFPVDTAAAPAPSAAVTSAFVPISPPAITGIPFPEAPPSAGRLRRATKTPRREEKLGRKRSV